MAARIVGNPVAQQARRSFAAQAAVATSEQRELVKAEPLKISSLKSGLTIASIENHSPIATVAVAIRAGSRNEEYATAGISHTLRIAAGLSTKNHSTFGITKNLQQVGASLTCTQGREHTLYTVQTTRDNTDLALDYLADVVSNQAFKPWELARNTPRMEVELALVSPVTQALELLHQTAFRDGLGNSLFCPAHKVGSHDHAALEGFVSKHFTSSRSALLGIGINHTSLTKYSELLSLNSGSGPTAVATKYYGGENRLEMGGSMAYVAIASNCAGYGSVADCVAAMLLQRVLGMGSQVKYGNGQGKLSLAAAAVSENASVSSVGSSYSDSGLLGAMVVCEASQAGKVVNAVAQAFRSVKVTDEEVVVAKKKMMADMLNMLELPSNLIENLGSQILATGDAMPDEKMAQLVASVTTADVQAAAKKISSSKLSMAAVGNLSTVPFLDSL